MYYIEKGRYAFEFLNTGTFEHRKTDCQATLCVEYSPLIFSQLVKTFPAFYRTLRYICFFISETV
jgi:hypothetical protein